MLLCLRADHEGVAGTRTACVREVLVLLGPAARRTWQQRTFALTSPRRSWGQHPGVGHVLFQ
ncbi:hypothetical protein [Streptomyces sp. RB110-2]|uniref:hypothetical protein n=1 Tax=unclassified Streptomyces TaxID=2593676 RepID=UPI0035ABD613